ncbi:MAG: LysM peptidoglycan-binding domain-containing protein [Nocardioidaceae bacterium]|nr:LysM peptidoglycan-binding domain-containing protein [Nocardioidaceae bacterium]
MVATDRHRLRLPVAADVPSRRAQIVGGIAALVGLLVIVVGLPFGLLAAFGAPWPDSMPSGSLLSAEISAGTLFSILTAAVWLAWAHFVLCVAVEVWTERRARGLAPRIPGGAIGTQALARRLVAAVMVLTGSAATVSAASAAARPSADQQPHSSSVQSWSPPAAAGAEGTKDSTASGASSPAAPDQVAGQRKGRVTYYDVKPPHGRNYDTLWDIAERYLGDGLRYKEIYRLNKDQTQPDGQVMTRADLIHPGWVIQLPSDAKGPELKIVDYGRGEDDMAAVTREVTARPAAAQSEAGLHSDVAPQSDVEMDSAAAGRSGDDADTRATEPQTPSWAPVFGVAGGLLAASLLMRLRRRSASMSAAALWAGRADTEPDTHGAGSGVPMPVMALREEADEETALWVDRALRAWNPVNGTVPAPARCTLGTDGLVMAFAAAPETAVREGWTARQDGRVWVADRSAAFGWTAPSAPSPVPGLVALGRRDDGSLAMFDLEGVPGLVSIGGEPVSARAVALNMAVDVAIHPWADLTRVTLVGFADDLSALGHIRHVDDVERAIESLDNVASFQRSGCRRADATSARTARMLPQREQEWTFELVVCSAVPDPGAVKRLTDLAADTQVGVAVVVVGDCPDAAARFAMSAQNRMTSGVLGIDVEAQLLTTSAYRSLAGLFAEPKDPAASQLRLDEVARVLAAEVEADVDRADVVTTQININVLGPIEVQTDGEVEEGRRELLTEILVFAALHPGGVHPDRFGAAIWPRGVDPSTRDAALAEAKRWLGNGPDHEALFALRDGAWALDTDHVSVDWDGFRAALNRGATQPGGDTRLLQSALDLVRGPAWTGLPGRRYAWLAQESVETDMPLAVVLTARVVAESCAQGDDAVGARDALLRGLAMAPASEELWRAALRLASRFGGPNDTRTVADQMYAAIAEHGSPGGAAPQTDALVDELLPGYRSFAA